LLEAAVAEGVAEAVEVLAAIVLLFRANLQVEVLLLNPY
jgi:hypothetical protein